MSKIRFVSKARKAGNTVEMLSRAVFLAVQNQVVYIVASSPNHIHTMRNSLGWLLEELDLESPELRQRIKFISRAEVKRGATRGVNEKLILWDREALQQP